MRADSFAGQVIAVLSRRTPALLPQPRQPRTFHGLLLTLPARRRTIAVFVAALGPVLFAVAAITVVVVTVSATTALAPRWFDDLPSGGAINHGDKNAIVGVENDKATLRQYLSGEVEIGVNGNLPGWSLVSGSEQASGFDLALIEFLQKRYDFTPKYVKLRSSEREDALRNGRVELVVANYSRTSTRDQIVDFAGPYFQDRSGIWCSDAKTNCDQPISQSSICVVDGTVAEGRLPGAQQRESIVACMDAFYDSGNRSIGAISTNETILRAYAHSIGSVGTVTWADERDHPISEEFYGIGLPNNRPDLCRALNDDIDDFLSTDWDAAFSRNLSGQDAFGHKPAGSDPRWCSGGGALLGTQDEKLTTTGEQ